MGVGVSRPTVAARAGPVLVVLAGALALIPVKLVLNEFVGGDVGAVPAMIVVILAVWLGFVPGLVATIAVILVEMTVFLQPQGILSATSEADRLRLGLLALAGLFASWLAWVRSRAERTARDATLAASTARARGALLVRRLAALQALAADIGAAVTTAQVADALAVHAGRALEADEVTVFLLGADDHELQAVAKYSHPAGNGPGTALPPTAVPLPVADVARTGESLFVEDWAASADPRVRSFVPAVPASSSKGHAVVPVEIEGQRFGVLAVSWDRAHELPPDRREFIVSMARLGAATFERARLLDAERHARARAEAVQRHLDLLAEAGRVLGLSLEYEVTLRRLAGLAVPLMGAVGIVDVLEPDGVRRLVATADEGLAAAGSILEAHPLDVAARGPIVTAMEEGNASVRAIDEPLVLALARTPDQAAAMRTIAARWMLTTPLRAQDRIIGALTFLRRDERAYDPEAVATAGELGDRAGRALENARLHRQVERLAERERRHAGELEAVIGAIGEGILVVDPGGAIHSSNAAATRLFGGPVGSMDELLDRLRNAGDERPVALAPGTAEYRLADRPTAWIEMTTYVIPTADALDALSSVVICRDVTAFRQGQALREAFLGLLSHELRTPVTTIYGGSSVLTRAGARIAPETQTDILEDIAGEADRLYRLVEDLMVLARFDEGIDLGAEPILLQHLVPEVAEQEGARWPALRISCEIEPDMPMVRGDETSITQVLRNLLSNAAKYSDAGSTIRVVVESVPEGAAIRVLDEGPGVDPAEVGHLFDPFYRSPSTAKLAGGAGIGLYVSRRLVDAMGGRIQAAPRPGRGSEFSVVLPLYGPEPDER